MGETWWSKDQAGQVNVNKETDMAENQGLKTIRSEEAVTTLLSTARQHRTPRKKRMTRSSKLWQKLEQAYVVEFASCNRELTRYEELGDHEAAEEVRCQIDDMEAMESSI